MTNTRYQYIIIAFIALASTPCWSAAPNAFDIVSDDDCENIALLCDNSSLGRMARTSHRLHQIITNMPTYKRVKKQHLWQNSLYGTLELQQIPPRFITQTDIRQAYRKTLFKYHPDKNPNPNATQKTQKIIYAYEILNNPIQRENYDAHLTLEW